MGALRRGRDRLRTCHQPGETGWRAPGADTAGTRHGEEEDQEQDQHAVRDASAQAEQRSAGDDQTGPVAEASEPTSDQRPTDADEPIVPAGIEAIGESDLQRSEEISS